MPAAGPDKRLCGAQRPNQPKGVTCTQIAGWGTDHVGTGPCRRHGGNTKNHKRAAEVVKAREACQSLGIAINVSPAEALLTEIHEAAGNVAFYRTLVQALPIHPGDDEYHPPAGEGDTGYWERGDPGIYGRTYHQSGVPTGEAKPHVLVQLYNDERKHLATTTVAALRVGIAQQQVELASRQAELIAEGFRSFAIALGHDPAEPKVREAFRAQLTLIAGGRAA